MEHDEEDNGAAGIIPEFGAIFMSSTVTKKECFKHKVFALPSSKAAFVEHVKTGMVLFLFEFETRKLFGVYQASSDGAMDIVPHAFNYSGRHFPAQVSFTPIWYCDPLSEKEFQDAIRENYFSTKKFNFGLSENQVRRLLSLFSSRKLKNKKPPHLPAEIDVGVADHHRGLVGGDELALNKRAYMESINYEGLNNADTFSNYDLNSLARGREEVLLGDGDDTKGKTYMLAQGNFLTKRRRVDNDDILITNYVKENLYDNGSLRTFCLDSPEDSFDDEIQRLDDARRLLRIESICNEEKLDRMFGHVLSSATSLDVATAADDSFRHRNRLFRENDIGSSSMMEFETECYRKSQEKGKHAIDDGRFLFDDCARREEHNHSEIVKPMAYSRGSLKLPQQAREMRDAHPWIVNRKLENRYHLDCDCCPVSAFENSGSLLHKLRKGSPCGRFLVNDIIESKSNVGTLSLDCFSSENCSCPLHCGHNNFHDSPYPIGEGRVTENTVDGIFCPASSTRNTGSMPNLDRQVFDGWLRTRERLENEENACKLSSPVISMEYLPFPKQKQSISSFSEKLVAEKGPSQLTPAYHNFDCPHATFDDATITRAVPCTPENPKFFRGCSASMAANGKSSLVLENHPHCCSVGNTYPLSKNRASACLLDMKSSSRSLNISSKYGNEVLPTNTSGHQRPLLHKATNSFENSSLSMQMNLNTSSVNYRGSVFPKPFSSLPSTDSENIEREKGMLLAYSTKSSENHFAFDGSRPMASHPASEHVCRQDIDMLSGRDSIHSEAKDSSARVHHPERDLVCYADKYFEASSYNLKNHPGITEAPDFNSSVIRRSVFTRLSSRQEFQVDEERHEIDSNCHDHYMDATADEVIEMLQQGGQPSAVNEKQSQPLIETNSPGMEKKMVIDVCTAFAESIDEVPKETRIVNFKRRSDTRKKLVGTVTKTAADNNNKIAEVNEEIKSSPHKTLKRKKLIRPFFGKIEPTADAICNNQNLHLVSQIPDKDGKCPHERSPRSCEAEMPNADNSLSSQSAECNIKKHSNPKKPKDIGACMLPSTTHELIGHKTANVGLQIGSSQAVLKETAKHKNFGIQTASLESASKDADANVSSLNLQESSSEVPNLGADCGSNLTKKKKKRKVKKKKQVAKKIPSPEKTAIEATQ